MYHKAGVVLDGLESPGKGQQMDLFGAGPGAAPAEPPVKERPRLMATLDTLNARFGRGTVRLASAVVADSQLQPDGRPTWEGKAQWRTPAYTTRLEDCLLVS